MLGGPVIQEHVVEFLLNSGVKTDGVLDSTSPSGPWTWVVPMGVAQIFVTGCGAGSGGTAGSDNTGATASGGGGGGGSGMCVVDFPVDVVQNASLTVTVGAKGAGGVFGVTTTAATAGGNTTIQGVVTPIMTDTGSTIRFLGGGAGTTPTGGAGIQGLTGGKCLGVGGLGSASATTPAAATVSPIEFAAFGVFAVGGSGGGGASSTPANAGGSGGAMATGTFRGYLWIQLSETAATSPTAGHPSTQCSYYDDIAWREASLPVGRDGGEIDHHGHI